MFYNLYTIEQMRIIGYIIGILTFICVSKDDIENKCHINNYLCPIYYASAYMQITNVSELNYLVRLKLQVLSFRSIGYRE